MKTKSQRCSNTTPGATPQQINIAATNWVLKIDNEVEGAGGKLQALLGDMHKYKLQRLNAKQTGEH